MTRQVRLDEDVVALVEARTAGLSLSAATNALLRTALTAPVPVSEPESGGTAHLVTRDGAPGPVRAVARRAKRFSGGCPHPKARRVGERCAQCGRTVR